MKPLLLIAGLGNPGTQYEQTRHNTGYLAVEHLAQIFGTAPWKPQQKFLALCCGGTIGESPVLFVKPTTFMNLSGDSLGKIIAFYKLNPASQLLVLCDDIDLPPGETRLRTKGGPGTHNGLKSVVDHFGEDFARLRIGIGAQASGEDLAAYVLSRPSSEERGAIGKAIESLSFLVQEWSEASS